MAYTKTNWVNDSIPAINASNLNKIEQGIYDNAFESGSNSNGDYIKFNDGTMICYKTVAGVADMSTPWGSLYEGTLALGDWPETFISMPKVNVTNISGTGAIIECFSPRPTTTSAGTVFLTRTTSGPGSVELNVFAIGRWK